MCKVSAIGDDEEDEAKPVIDALASRLLEITDLSTRSGTAPASVPTSPGDFDGLDLDGITTPTLTIPCKRGTTEKDLPPKDTPLYDRLHD